MIYNQELEILNWIKAQNVLTAKCYRSNLNSIAKISVFRQPGFNFTEQNNKNVIQSIKKSLKSESTKQCWIACFISLCRHLNFLFGDIINVPSSRTLHRKSYFFKLREKNKKLQFEKNTIHEFIEKLKTYSHSSYAIAYLIYSYCRKPNEVLKLKKEDLNFNKETITFTQSMTKGFEKKICVNCDQEIFSFIKENLKDFSQYVFTTRYGLPIHYSQLFNTFASFRNHYKIKEKITPYTLTVSAIGSLLKSNSAHEVMKLSGHLQLNSVIAHDHLCTSNWNIKNEYHSRYSPCL